MALSDVLKKKEATGEAAAKEAKEKKNIMDDVRLVIAIIVVACIALIALIIYTTGVINQTNALIDSAKQKYQQNQAEIANLLALQARSGDYIAQKEQYDSMISSDQLDSTEIMIDLDKFAADHNCVLESITFDDITNTGLVNQIAANVKISGSFADVMKFCQDTVNSNPIKRIDTIKLAKNNNTGMSAELVIVEFSK